MSTSSDLDLLFEPIQIGTMAVPNRIMVPAHGARIGPIVGTDEQAAAFRAYYAGRAKGGAGWVGGGNAFVRNPIPPGFEPTGVGASTDGTFRHPNFVANYRQYVDEVHAYGAVATVQMILQGGVPLSPSAGGSRDRCPSCTSWATPIRLSA